MTKTFLWRSLQLSKWLIKSKSCHAVHSPLLYKMCRHVFCQPSYESKWLFKKWLSSLPPEYKHIAKKSAIHPYDAKLLLGLARFCNPGIIIEIGTGFGFSTVVLHHASPTSPILTFETDNKRRLIAQTSFHKIFTGRHALQQVQFINKRFPPDSLNLPTTKPFFMFIDGGHNKQQMNLYAEWMFKKLPKKSVVVLHDIYWSEDMLQSWQSLWDNERTTFWVDMFRLGVLILDYPAQKMQAYLRPGPPLFIPL